MPIKKEISNILDSYKNSFSIKKHSIENSKPDLLMELFGITPKIKLENKQYWGRELGLCWQKIITEIIITYRNDYITPNKIGKQEFFDTGFGKYAIDTKYRIGSGDSGTLNKFKRYANSIRNLGKTPILLILRTDNLESSIKFCRKSGWKVLTGKETLHFIERETGFQLEEYLKSNKGNFKINRF